MTDVTRDHSKAIKYWNFVIEELNSVTCIYSGKTITKDILSVDHFIPWTFTSHDLLWNFTPTTKQINSSKGNNLPKLELYLDKFVELQYDSFHIVLKYKKESFVEDYSNLYQKTITEIRSMSINQFTDVIKNTIRPQIQIAKSMGFRSKWAYNYL